MAPIQIYQMIKVQTFLQSDQMRKIEITVLILCIGIIIGFTYGLDIPMALEKPLREAPYNLTTMQFNMLYIMMYLPMLLFDMPLGNLIDRMAIQKILIPLLILQFSTQLLQALMFHFLPHQYFSLVLLSRSLFGLVGDGIYSIQGKVLSKYCADNYEFMTSLAWGFGYLSDSLSSLVTTISYNQTQEVSTPIYIGSFVCLFSLAAGVVLMAVLRGQTKKKKEQDSLKESLLSDGRSDQGEAEAEEERSIVKDVRSLTKTFWVTIIGIFLIESAVSNFLSNINDLIIKRFGFTYLEAGRFGMIPNGVLTVVALLAGKLISDHPQYRRLCYVLSSAEFFAIIIVFYFVPNSSSPSLMHYFVVLFFFVSISVSLGIFYSGIFTCVPFAVEEKVVGTAWGFSGMAIGLASCLMPFIYSTVVEMDEENLAQGYLNLTLVGVVAAFLSLIHSLYVYYGEFGVLDLKFSQIEQMKKEGKTLDQIIAQYS